MDLPRVDRPNRDVKSVFFRDRNAWLCSLLFCICVLAAYPISNEGYVDDFSTAHTALLFAQTGHLIYDGWMAPLQGWLAPWGALFIKLFGFSFVVLRMAVLPF